MAKAKPPIVIEPEAVYAITLHIKGENLSRIVDGLPGGLTVEQSILFRLFRETVSGSLNAKHFLEWHEAFEAAVSGIQPVKVKKAQRLEPIPPLAPDRPADPEKTAKKVVGTGRRKAAKKK